MATAHKIKPAGKATEGLRVRARTPQGIRRAGRQWGPEPTEVSLAELSEDQVAQLRDEPLLIVDDVTLEPAKG